MPLLHPIFGYYLESTKNVFFAKFLWYYDDFSKFCSTLKNHQKIANKCPLQLLKLISRKNYLQKKSELNFKSTITIIHFLFYFFRPAGWDNEKKVAILYENMHSMRPDQYFTDVIAKPIGKNHALEYMRPIFASILYHNCKIFLMVLILAIC